MKKRLSFTFTSVILIIFSFLYFYVVLELLEPFEVLESSSMLAALVMFIFLLLVQEILFRAMPGEFEPPSMLFFSLSFRDRVVILVSGFFFVVFLSISFEIKYTTSAINRFAMLVIGLAVCYSPIWLFGSSVLKQKLLRKKK